MSGIGIVRFLSLTSSSIQNAASSLYETLQPVRRPHLVLIDARVSNLLY